MRISDWSSDVCSSDLMFEDVRGLGLMLGVKMKSDYDARAFVAHLRDNHGLLTVSAGQNVVRILPPLVIEESHVAECVERLRSEEHTSELQSLLSTSYAVFCLKKQRDTFTNIHDNQE